MSILTNEVHAKENPNELILEIRNSTAAVGKALGSVATSKIGLASLIGLFSFALPNMMNSMWQCGFLRYPDGTYLEAAVANEAMMSVVLMAFVGQFLAGLWNLTKGDTFGSVSMGCYGLFWLVYYYYIQYIGNAAGALSDITIVGGSPFATGMANNFIGSLASHYAGGPTGNALVALIENSDDITFIANKFFGFVCIPWLILTTIFCACALRMALLEFWIFFIVEMVFVTTIGNLFSYPGTTSQFHFQIAAGVFSLILAITSWYFLSVALINQIYNAPILPSGHSHPIIKSWPYEFGSLQHQDTNRNLNIHISEADMKKKVSKVNADNIYDVQDELRRTETRDGRSLPMV